MTSRLLALLLLLGAPAGAAISYVGTATPGSRTTGTSHGQTVPAHSVDDLVVIWTASDGSETLTIVNNTCTETWSYQAAVDEGTTTGRLAHMVATGTASCTVDVTGGTTEAAWSTVAVFSGTDTATIFGVSNTATGVSDAPSVTQTTGVTSGSWAVACMGMDRNSVVTDSGYPTNTTGIHSGRSGSGSGDAGGSCGYDSTATSSEGYTWGTQDRSDGFTAGVYEILEPVTADTMMLIGAP